MSRKIAREVAFKIVFEYSFQDDDAVELYQRYIQSEEEQPDLNEEDKKYILEIVSGIKDNISKLDEKIQAHLKDWNLDRINKVDVAILRLAIYEILYREDIPPKVSINEAVEISKQFSEDSSPSFVNGVLGEIIKETIE